MTRSNPVTHPALVHQPGCVLGDHSAQSWCRDESGDRLGPAYSDDDDEAPLSFVDAQVEANRVAIITTKARIDELVAMRADINTEVKACRALLVGLEAAARHFAKLDPDDEPDEPDERVVVLGQAVENDHAES